MDVIIRSGNYYNSASESEKQKLRDLAEAARQELLKDNKGNELIEAYVKNANKNMVAVINMGTIKLDAKTIAKYVANGTSKKIDVRKVEKPIATTNKPVKPSNNVSVSDRVTGFVVGVVKTGFRIAAVTGSGALELFSGGTATPLAITTAAFGGNSALGGMSDMYNSTIGDPNSVGKVNPAKDLVQFASKSAFKAAGTSEDNANSISEKVATVVDLGDTVVSGYGIKTGLTKVLTTKKVYTTISTTVIGKVTTVTPKPTVVSKAVTSVGVCNDLKSVYDNIKEALEKIVSDSTNK